MTRKDYFLAWPHERVAQLAAEQEAHIKELQELITSLHENRDLLLAAWRKEVSK